MLVFLAVSISVLLLIVTVLSTFFLYKLNLITEQQLLLEAMINQLQADNQLLVEQLETALAVGKLKSFLLFTTGSLLFYLYFSTSPGSGPGFSLGDISDLILSSSAKITSISSTEHAEVLRRSTLTFDICEKLLNILLNLDVAERLPLRPTGYVPSEENMAAEAAFLGSIDFDGGDIVFG